MNISLGNLWSVFILIRWICYFRSLECALRMLLVRIVISPLRCVNQAIYLLTTGARESAFKNIKTIVECLADELINGARGSSNTYAIKKKDEIERVAKANH
ncbi:hypothetical protein SOVF_151860 [Spinacia oleracea]|nr:hypothetical protein SOVF_151860 [Spinacia oleracea]